MTTSPACSGDVAELLQVIIDKAPALRSAGVFYVELPGGGGFSLQPQAPKLDRNELQEQSLKRAFGNPLDDFATHGGRSVPGFQKLREKRWGDH